MSDLIFDELSSGTVPCSFLDRNDNDVIPNWVRWTLTTKDGLIIINNREQESFLNPGSSIEILLQGPDLQILLAEAHKRVVARKITVEAEYDSDLGNDLPLKGEHIIRIKNLGYIS